jgi:hypothetical protein
VRRRQLLRLSAGVFDIAGSLTGRMETAAFDGSDG